VSGAIADKATVDFVRRQGARAKVRHLRVHGRLRAGRCRPAEGSARHHALGLHGSPAHGGRDLREGPRRARRQRLHRRRGHRPASTLRSPSPPRWRVPRRRSKSSSRSSTTRAALLCRPSRPRAGRRSRGPGGALRVTAADLPRRAASRR
jgi:hypothetical protein